jgi:hypothetical protein
MPILNPRFFTSGIDLAGAPVILPKTNLFLFLPG